MAAEKSVVDEPAKRSGLTDEELDFVINYDIRCRMGREEHGEIG
jgi:hypothetical protein